MANYKILEAASVAGLNVRLQEHIEEGWEPVGSHQVVIEHMQNRFAGNQHKDSVYTHLYSITVKTETHGK